MTSKSKSKENTIPQPEKSLIPELIELIRCINEYYTLKDSMGHGFMSEIKDMADDSDNNSMVPKDVDLAIEKAFVAQLKMFS